MARGNEEENAFAGIMNLHLHRTKFVMVHKPLDLAKIYGSPGHGPRHGIRPTFKIHNQATNKSIFVDLKRQHDDGNAHERSCRCFMPGIIKSAGKIGKHPEGVVPFWIVLAGKIAGDPRHREKITHWFQDYERNLLLWPDFHDRNAVIEHFENHIRSMLE